MQRFGHIDILKLIFSFCVIAIHTSLLSDFNDDVNWYITHIILRLAVPFFFVASGFFYGKKIIKSNNIDKITYDYIKKLIYPFIFWLLISLPIEFLKKYKGDILSTIIILIKKVLFYPWGALWYISALIVSIFILSKFYKRNKYYLPIVIGIILYVFGLISNSYYFIINNSILKNIIDGYRNIFITSRNGIFVGIIYVSVGVLIYKLYSDKKIINIKKSIIYFILCYMVLIFEVYFIRSKLYIDDNSLFISMPLLMFLFFNIILNYECTLKTKLIRNYSIALYFIHKTVILYLTYIFNIEPGIKLFFITILISTSVYLLIKNSKNKYLKKVIYES